MRGVGVIEFGGPEALRVVDLPEVHPGPGEVRLRVRAATVNPTDTYTRNGARAEQLAKDPPPYIPGKMPRVPPTPRRSAPCWSRIPTSSAS